MNIDFTKAKTVVIIDEEGRREQSFEVGSVYLVKNREKTQYLEIRKAPKKRTQ